MVGAALLVGTRRGVATPQVTFVGKSATFGLYVFLPLSYLAYGHSDAWHAIGVWGAVASAAVYWWRGSATSSTSRAGPAGGYLGLTYPLARRARRANPAGQSVPRASRHRRANASPASLQSFDTRFDPDSW